MALERVSIRSVETFKDKVKITWDKHSEASWYEVIYGHKDKEGNTVQDGKISEFGNSNRNPY